MISEGAPAAGKVAALSTVVRDRGRGVEYRVPFVVVGSEPSVVNRRIASDNEVPSVSSSGTS